MNIRKINRLINNFDRVLGRRFENCSFLFPFRFVSRKFGDNLSRPQYGANIGSGSLDLINSVVANNSAERNLDVAKSSVRCALTLRPNFNNNRKEKLELWPIHASSSSRNRKIGWKKSNHFFSRCRFPRIRSFDEFRRKFVAFDLSCPSLVVLQHCIASLWLLRGARSIGRCNRRWKPTCTGISRRFYLPPGQRRRGSWPRRVD